MFMDWKTYDVLFKMAVLPQTIYRFSVVPIKTPVPPFFCIKEKPNSHIYPELQGVPNSQNNTEEEKAWGLTLLNFKIYCKAEIISYWHMVDIWTDRIQVWVEKLIIYGQFIFDMGAQFSPVTQLCPTLCDPMDCSTPGLPVHHQLPDFTQTHVHWVGDAIQPSHPLSSPSPPAFSLSQHQGLFQWVSSSYQVAKVLEFQLQH